MIIVVIYYNHGTCTTDNGVQLTSCTMSSFNTLTCTRTEPSTGGTTTTGGVTGEG